MQEQRSWQTMLIKRIIALFGVLLLLVGLKVIPGLHHLEVEHDDHEAHHDSHQCPVCQFSVTEVDVPLAGVTYQVTFVCVSSVTFEHVVSHPRIRILSNGPRAPPLGI